MARKRLTVRQKLVKELDEAFSDYIIARDKKCVTCGSTEQLNCSHLISRRKSALRWDETNCNCQCYPCNCRHNYYPHFYTQWFIDKYGKAKYDELCQIADKTHKWELWDLALMLGVIKSKLSALLIAENSKTITGKE